MPRTWLILAAVAALLAVGATAAVAGTKTVKIGDNWFVRSSGSHAVTVDRNTLVKWTWVGDSKHNLRARKVPSDESKSRFSESSKKTGSFSRKMTVSGTYKLYCSIHDYDDQEMVLRVRSN